MGRSLRVWNKYFVWRLKEFGSDESLGDPCTIRLRGKQNPSKIKMMLHFYVEDIIIASSSANRDALVRYLRESFATTNAGEPTRTSRITYLSGTWRGRC